MSRVRSIPSLDGLRAVSISIVILAHTLWAAPSWINSTPVRAVLEGGRRGVGVFFVISGFLITTLLLREQDRTGKISLRNFYWRRCLRIFPPFYVFLATVVLTWLFAVQSDYDSRSFLAAATFTFALYPLATSAPVFHSWSLSVEEIFYVFWPFTLIRLGRKNALRAALTLVVILPIVRLVILLYSPLLRAHMFFLIQGWVDTMMIGCALALVHDHPRWVRWRNRWLTSWNTLALTIFAFFLPLLFLLLTKPQASVCSVLIEPTIFAACVAAGIANLTTYPGSLVARILNSAVLTHLGTISYSIYLWQQLFTLESGIGGSIVARLCYAMLCAEASYFLIERPARLWAQRRQLRLTSGGAPPEELIDRKLTA